MGYSQMYMEKEQVSLKNHFGIYFGVVSKKPKC